MKEKINKDILAKEISVKYGMTNVQSREIVDYVFDRSTEVLENKGEVSIFGFGKFETKERAERKGFNPSSKEGMTIQAATVVSFNPAKALRESVKR